MVAIQRLADRKFDNSGFGHVPAPTSKPGCRGEACPAFQICQGRCASGTVPHRNPLDLYPGHPEEGRL